MILLFLATFLANVQTRQVPLTSSLFLEDRNTLEGRIKNAEKDGIQTVHLSNAEMITRTIQVASDEILLIGNNTTLEYCIEGSSSEKKNEWKDRMFMFSVWNSSFRVEGVRAFCITNQTGVCLISSSNVYFSLSTLISDGYHSPFSICSSNGSNDQSSSLIVLSRCTHESPTHLVAPFVDEWHSRNDREISASQSDYEHIGEPDHISVVGTGILISSKTLWMGTGPLFSFGMASNDHWDFGSVCVTSMDTNMNFCELVNMSSRTDGFSDFGKSGKKLRDFRQQIVGSSVCLSSNHDRGTGMLDVNLGGSLSCVNTSFSSCVREVNSETEKSESFTAFVQGDRFSIDSTSLLTSVSYTLCSFKEMSVEVSGLKGGAAICLFQSSASLTVTQCFFHKCTVTGHDNDGGAISVLYSSENQVISKSSFTECKTVGMSTNYAAALLVSSSSQLTLDNCFFETCSASFAGVVFSQYSPTALSNCVFEFCSAYASGGALSLSSPPSVDFSFLQFRECVCTGAPASKDIYFRGVSSEIANSNTIKFCDSISGSPNVFFETGEVEDSTLVPQLEDYMMTEITSSEVLVGEDKATITISITSSVKGVMGVLLEGSNVPRLVHVEFGTPDSASSTGTAEVSIGRQGILPILTDGQSYSIRSVSIPGRSIVGSIQSFDARLRGTSEASFELKGCFLTTRPYSMKVRDSENNNFTIPLSPSSGSLTGTSPLSSTDPTKLKYGDDYAVFEVLDGSQPLYMFVPFVFIIDYPLAKPTGIEQTDGTDSMTITFLGEGLVASGYTVTLKEQGGGETPHTKTVSLVPSSESRLTPWTAKLYPVLEADLKYRTEYSLTSFDSSYHSQPMELVELSFRTPNEPSCLTNVSFSRLYDDEKKAEVSVEGRVMSVGETYTLHLNETGTQTGAKMNVSFSSATNGKGTGIVFSQREEEIELEYDTNYTVVNVTDSSNNGVLFAAGLTFKTDPEPTRLVSFSVVGLDSGGKRVLFGMSGRKLNSDEIYEVELSKSGTTRLTVEMKWNGESGRWEGSGVVYPVEGAELDFGEVLDVKRFLQQGGSTDLLCEGGSVTISDEPARLVSLKSSVEEGLNETTLTVETRALEVGKNYTLTLSGTPLSSPSSSNDVDTRIIQLTATSETLYVFSLSLYPLTSADLLFGHTYSASSMAIGSNVSILIETAECSFSTPVEPERVVSVSAGNFGSTSLNSTIDLSFSSRALLPSTEYTLTFTSVASQDRQTHSKSLKLRTTENGVLECHEAVLYPFETEESKRNSQFEIDGTPVRHRNDFICDSEGKPRIANVSFSRLYDDEKKAEVSVEGRVMSVGETYTLHLNETGTQTGAKMNVSFSSATNGKGTGIVFSQREEEIELEYDTNYTVVNVTDSSNNGVLFAAGLTFKTDPEPTRLVSFSVVGLDSGGKRVLGDEVERRIRRWEGSGVAYPVEGAELDFGEVLDVKRFLQQGGSTDLLCEGGSVTISDEPARLVSLKSSVEEGLNETTLTVETRALEVGKNYTLTLSGTPLSSPSSSNDVDTRTIHLVPTSETSYVFSLSLYPLTSADLLFGHTYSASSMAIGSNVSILIETAECSFSTPVEPERVVSVSAGNFGSTSLNSTIDLSFSSRALLPSTEYTLTFTSVASQDRQTHSKSLKLRTTENGVLECHEAVLYPFETEESKRNSQFEFETTYVLSSLERGSTELLFDIEMISFVIPKEKPRIANVSFSRLYDDEKKAEVSVEGRVMSVGETYTLHLNETGTQTGAKMNVSFSSATNGKGTGIVFSQREEEIELEYDTNYTVVNVTDSSNNGVLFAAGLTFKTDPEPTRLVSFSVVGLDSGGKRVLFGMSGRKLNSDEIYEVELSKSGTTRFTVEMKWNGESGRWEGSGVAYPVEGAELDFGEVLDVKRFLQQGGSTDLLCEGGSVTISDEPARLVSLKSSVEEGLNETTLTVETRALEVGKNYTLTLSGTPLSSPSSSNDVDTRTIHLVPTSETSYVFSLSLYPLTSADLLFGHTYSASSMAIGSNVSILIETAECSFSTPVEPERVVSVSAGNFGSTSLNSTIDLSFSSRALLPSTEYTLTFTSVASQDRQTHSKSLKLRTTENGVLECHEAVLYPFETEESKRNSQFEFETTYVLSSLERGSTELLTNQN
ncbi:hypothetical protein BLNAU_13524 [Blattamonas nauphoetae]|uniref:Uncharacterized protein n=1 Tax=Blattamonas nauphoetae TaxID=2049346 RepID=A0ABQ9XGA1_9EUKA|nr:hypothetical protein BLNAU_13524 [Blattamonas nauphoetae]